MNPDITDIDAFYRCENGQLLSGLIRKDIAQISRYWARGALPSTLEGLAVGFPFAFIGPTNLPAVLMPAEIGALAWPGDRGVIVASIDSSAWPVASEMAEALLVVHAVEHVRDQQGFLQECWRVLTSSGELILVVPHRRGFWAGAEKTPFGQGRPFSRRQIVRQLNAAGFDIENVRQSVFIPPFALNLPAAFSVRMDRLGRYLWGIFGGVLIIRATKKLYSPHVRANPALRHRVRQFIVRRPSGVLSPQDNHKERGF